MKIAIYPGTFDPITLGHLDIIERASQIFDQVIIAVAEDNEKTPLFNITKRKKMITESTHNIKRTKVESFNGLLVEYADSKDAISIIRGLRVLSDFEYEFKMALMNRSLNQNIVTVFLMPHEKYTHLSSSLVREVSRLNGDVSNLVPKCVLKSLIERFSD